MLEMSIFKSVLILLPYVKLFVQVEAQIAIYSVVKSGNKMWHTWKDVVLEWIRVAFGVHATK